MFKNESDDARANVARLARFIKCKAAQQRDVLVVCQKAVEEALLSQRLPENVRLEHFNALRGLDGYRDVACGIVVGRPMPRNSDLEVMTEGLHFDNPDVTRFEAAECEPIGIAQQLNLKGSGRAVILAESHPDPRVRAMRRQIVDAEVRQAIMRLRLYDRTEDNRAEIFVFGQVDTDLAIDELGDWYDAERIIAEVLVASGVISGDEPLLHKIANGELSRLKTRQARQWVGEANKLIDWPTWRIPTTNGLVRAQIDPAKANTSDDVRERE